MEIIKQYLPDLLKPVEERKLPFYDVGYGEVMAKSDEVWNEFKAGSLNGEGVFCKQANEHGGHEFIEAQIGLSASLAGFTLLRYRDANLDKNKKVVRSPSQTPPRDEVLRALGKIHFENSRRMNQEEIFDYLKSLK